MDPILDKLMQGGAAGIVIAICAAVWKLADVYLKTRKAKRSNAKLNGSHDHEVREMAMAEHRATAEALTQFAVVQRDSLEIIRSIRTEAAEAHRRLEERLEKLPAETAIHVKASS